MNWMSDEYKAGYKMGYSIGYSMGWMLGYLEGLAKKVMCIRGKSTT